MTHRHEVGKIYWGAAEHSLDVSRQYVGTEYRVPIAGEHYLFVNPHNGDWKVTKAAGFIGYEALILERVSNA